MSASTVTSKINEKIAEIELEMSRTQINKATMHHICLLKARLARLKREELEIVSRKSGASGPGFEVRRSGDARIGLFGFPSVGKSTLLNSLTGATSKVGAYEFTTLTPVPGIITINGAKIQILDLPGIIEGAADGVGRGKQVIAIARTCSLILMVLDGMQSLELLKILEAELGGYGIKLNKTPPKIRVDKRDRNGIAISSTCPQPELDDETITQILKNDYKIHHAVVRFEQRATIDDLIDVLEGNRVYLPCIYVINKCDQLSQDQIAEFSKRPDTICVSAQRCMNLDTLVSKMWDYLDLIRVYTQKKGEPIDPEPLVLYSHKCTIHDFCEKIHTSLLETFRFAWVTGTSVKYYPSKCGLSHQLHDGDIVTLICKG
ncbi:Developmentally-regulated GTP-binding protein 1 [Tritrichomonas foetus]|uniref:Developmentally-regulated GTP-binding protein 1 n=1 Tax=Tritrichomonas foetus TaxID=1144522 RepID=A0A1J4KRR3_9EUKA|nr:Developmentally-regulated GTP-binding protein 1 [Tritrichomonas foetus]|eukprot:OHT13584.1 Developmentally-regulated GTP-binding protein 1 [Tritrichomonas foetus]